MIRRPPRSTLFPTRRSSDLDVLAVLGQAGVGGGLVGELQRVVGEERPRVGDREGEVRVVRSEEHTSELQSRQYLVCRLLLEKKKNENMTLELGILRAKARDG